MNEPSTDNPTTMNGGDRMNECRKIQEGKLRDKIIFIRIRKYFFFMFSLYPLARYTRPVALSFKLIIRDHDMKMIWWVIQLPHCRCCFRKTTSTTRQPLIAVL